MSDTVYLALETATRSAGVALARGQRLLAERFLPPDRPSTSELFPVIDDVLRAHGLKLADVEMVCFSQGPGSFTGLRIAATFAQMAFSVVGCRVVAVSTLAALARNALDAGCGAADLVIPMLDARRSQVFAAVYELGRGGQRETTPVGIHDPITLISSTVSAVRQEARRREDIGAAGRVAVLGEGVRAHRAACEAAGAALLPEPSWKPRAARVLEIGREIAEGGRCCRPEEIVPRYIRVPECEEVYEERRAAARARRGVTSDE